MGRSGREGHVKGAPERYFHPVTGCQGVVCEMGQPGNSNTQLFEDGDAGWEEERAVWEGTGSWSWNQGREPGHARRCSL